MLVDFETFAGFSLSKSFIILRLHSTYEERRKKFLSWSSIALSAHSCMNVNAINAVSDISLN